MACFIVPATEALVTTVATKIIEKKEGSEAASEIVLEKKERFSAKLKRLNHLLWGGSALLAFEHLWHGEVQPFMPFLTAAKTAEGTTEMLHEMSTVGVGMAVLTTAVWGVVTFVSSKIAKRPENKNLV